MSGRAELNRRIEAWLKKHNQSPRQLSLDAGFGEGMIRRILEKETYRSKSDTWRQLARYLNWDQAEVLMLAGFSEPATSTDGEPLAVIEQQLRRLLLTQEECDALMIVVRQFVENRQQVQQGHGRSRSVAQ